MAIPKERHVRTCAQHLPGHGSLSLGNNTNRMSDQQGKSRQSLHSSSSSSQGDFSTNPLHDPGIRSLGDRLLSGLESDNDEEDEKEFEEEIRFADSFDESDQDQSVTVTERAEFIAGEEQDQRTWYERSEEALARQEPDGEKGDHFQLSERQARSLERGGKGRAFYTSFNPNPAQLLEDDPERYKRCQLKIEGSHRAKAKALDKSSKYTEILIDGRSKAGRTYMDDVVVIEILAEPHNNRRLQQVKGASAIDESMEKMAHGKVVGLLKRVNFAGVEHPVLFCTLDEMEGHLMKPLCKTVPKIHVMNDGVCRKYPALKKNMIEIKRLADDGSVQHKGFFNVQPDKREQYVFKVVILAWSQQDIYPLGMVLEARISGRDYDGGLEILSMQQCVPKHFPRAAVEDVRTVLQQVTVKMGREDLTGERLFTIDPPGSRDLDDAISIKMEGPHYVIGVHIPDVAAVVKKGSGVDLEAKKRGVTFYPINRGPHPMLPEPLSHGKCSLLPDEERLAFSVIFRFDSSFNRVGEPVVKRTVIKSCQQLTYEEAQSVIDNQPLSHIMSSVQSDIQQIYKITSMSREARRKKSILFIPFEDPRFSDMERVKNNIEAHAMIEELMILTNWYIASRLCKQPRLRNMMLVRCHKVPTWEELKQWEEREGHVSNLVMQLQGQHVSPNNTLSLDNLISQGGPAHQNQPVVVQSAVWTKLCQHLEHGEVEEARRLACMDALHPRQCLACNSWMDMMDTAQYRCLYGLNGLDMHHFGLGLDIYTHFTSPLRRYADLHVQRLLHADLDGQGVGCTPEEVMELSQQLNSAMFRRKAFDKGCFALRVADSLQQQPLVFRAYVESMDVNHLNLHVPSLQAISARRQELAWSMLGVSTQPELITDTALKQDSVTVQWNRRIYDEKQNCPGNLVLVRKHLSRQNAGNSPSTVTVRPDLLSKSVKEQDWIKILQMLTSNSQHCLSRIPQPQSTIQSEADSMSSEMGGGMVSYHPVQYQRVYKRGQIVQIQMSAEPNKGMLKPRVDILHTANNACVCKQHLSNPVLTFTQFATRPTRDQEFSTYREYVKAWMPLLEMEACVGAVRNTGGFVINNVPVSMKSRTSSSMLYRGSFSLTAQFCASRHISIGGKTVTSTGEVKDRCHNIFPLDYLCLRYWMPCSSAVISRVKQSEVSEAVDKDFTWLAHASVVHVAHQGQEAEDGGHLVVSFVLSPTSPEPPPQLLEKGGARMTIELLLKSDVDR